MEHAVEEHDSGRQGTFAAEGADGCLATGIRRLWSLWSTWFPRRISVAVSGLAPSVAKTRLFSFLRHPQWRSHLNGTRIVLFKTPNHFAFGGTSGVSVILSTLFPSLPVGAFMWIINIALVVLGFIFLERKAILWSVFASFALSGYVSLFEMLFPGASTTSITGDMWLDLCFAVILPAIGSAMVFDIGASTGGTDILAMIFKRHSTLEIGRALLLVDIGIVCIAAVLYGPRVGLYCVLGLFAKTLVVDKAIESIHLRKVCTIICKEPLKVETYIVKELNRTATISRGYGAFSGQLVTVIMCVLSRREAVKLRRYAREVDPGCFITIVDSSEIVGKGFRGVN